MEELQELEQTKKLTPKQERFVQEYINCGIAGLAYSIAYGLNWDEPKDNLTARTSASRLLTNDNIKARVQEVKAEQQRNCVIDRQMLIDLSMAIIKDARKGTPEMKMNRDGKFVPTGNYIQDNKAANEAIKNIMRMLGLDEQKINADVNANVEQTICTAKDVVNELIHDD